MEQLDIYIELLLKWQKKINLISNTTISSLQSRHVDDSLQLLKFIPENTIAIIDLGSGAGLPGIPLSIASKIKTYLVESDKRKSIFLQEAVRATKCDADVINRRAEEIVIPDIDGLVVITMRAFASLEKIFATVNSFLEKNNVASYRLILLKGKNVSRETLEAKKRWEFNAVLEKSETDEDASIVIIDKFKRK